ncbi:MAG: TRAP transporter small permease [Burkholderiales bacterium]
MNLRAVLNRLHHGLQWLLAASVAVLIVPVMMQILSRYTGFIPRYIWTEELARFCFIWMIMIGAMIAVREGTHFDVDLWPPLPTKANAALRIITHIAMLVFAIVFLYFGYQFALFGANQSSELAELPMWLIFIAWPLAGAFWLLFLAEKFAEDFSVLRGGVRP